MAALAGAISLPAAWAPPVARCQALPPQGEVRTLSRAETQRSVPSESCLAETVCAFKNSPRWRKAHWTPAFCRTVARGILESSKLHDLQPGLLLAVMINESDLNEAAVNVSDHNDGLLAKDSGLMGIRCLVDSAGRCTNGGVRGMPWKKLMDPLTNIETGARELARWRNGAATTKVTTRVRGTDGRIRTVSKSVPCAHKTHAYWAHYNHGPRYLDHGPARHYPHRIAVLYHALAESMNVEAPELRSMAITVRDPGTRPRTFDRPVEERYRRLCDRIRDSGASCGKIAAVAPPALN